MWKWIQSSWHSIVLLQALLTLVCSAPVANASPPPLPVELEPWVPFVLERHPELSCPVQQDQALCLWPGQLELALDARGGTFRQSVYLDRVLAMPLPGRAGAWPQSVRVDGRPAPVLDLSGTPSVRLEPGTHSLSGLFRWDTLPGTLPVPPAIGIVRLSLYGQTVLHPQLSAEGLLRLSAGDAGAREEDRLELEVARRITDGIPVSVETHLELRASGSARELDLGQVLLTGSRPVLLEANLPARLNEAGSLVVQLRPGTYAVSITALLDGPLVSLSAPSHSAPWPEQEYWVVEQNDQLRSTQLSGPSGIDPARAPLPDHWKSLPTFLVKAGETLQVAELRRGEPEPAPSEISLQRILWLDLDGRGFTVRDEFSGILRGGWRLDILPPAVLGQALVSSEAQVITLPGGLADSAEGSTPAAGVELRETELQMVAESRIPERHHTLPSVGWNTDVSSLSLELRLPPGWKLAAVSGADGESSALLDLWTLFDLFFVLIVAMAVARLAGRLWGGLALLTLILTRQMGYSGQESVPEWTWVVLLVLLALLRVAPEGGWRKLLELCRWVTVATLFVLLVDFSIGHLRAGVFPALERTPSETFFEGSSDLSQGSFNSMPERFAVLSSGGGSAGAYPGQEVVTRKRLKQDPAAVVQTGPGLPNWQWHSYIVRFSGPVTPDQSLTFVLLGPWMNRFLAFLRVALLIALALRLTLLDGTLRTKLSSLGGPGGPGGGPATWALFLVPALLGLAPAPAHAQEEERAPSTGALQALLVSPTPSPTLPPLVMELEKVLTRPPACAPHCVSVSSLDLALANDRLTLTAEVHAEAAGTWLVPGPVSSWSPSDVQVNGSSSPALMRHTDGFIHLRLSPGVHFVQVTGTLPASGALTLQLGLVPHRMAWSGEGWTLDGLRADGTTEQAIKLVRVMSGAGSQDLSRSASSLSPWLEVHRTLELGTTWTVHTEVVRKGAVDSPISVKVPLLPGESVNVARFQVQGGQVLVAMNRDETSVGWESSLPQGEALELKVREDVAWTERWSVSCGAMFACRYEGLAPIQHVQDNRWSPLWLAWPGESVTVRIARPLAAPGQTLTLQKVELAVELGQNQASSTLSLQARSSQGGQLPLELPPGARLQSVQVGERVLPLQLLGGRLTAPIQPGETEIRVTWQQPLELKFLTELPPVALGGPAVNVEVEATVPSQRWILGLVGPMWGPVPLFWSYVLIILLAAPFLSRLRTVPLSRTQWALLGLGLIPLPPPVAAIVVFWLLAVSARSRLRISSWWRFDFVQLCLAGLTLAALGVIYASIHVGLLEDAPSRISGHGSSNTFLSWYVDRVESTTPSPLIVSLPLWVWRMVMLAWSMWMAASLLRWLPWVWRCITVEGIFRKWGEKAPELSAQATRTEASAGKEE